jgi:peptidoglycan/xylan/chitin deacetylase (PgdA/CDA1 family)
MREYIADITYALRQKSIRILTYHSISEESNPFAIKPHVFREQMELIKHSNYNVISLNEAVNSLRTNEPEYKSLVLTFDDGYKDNYINASPILREFNFSACFFIVTGAVAKKSNWDDWRLDLMNWDEISHLSETGYDIGSHTHSHKNLSGEGDYDNLFLELEESGQLLKEKLKTACIPFAYPYGAGVYNNKVREIAARVFSCAVRSNGFFGNNPTTDLWSLKRVRIDSDIALPRFKQIIAGHSDITQSLLMLKNRYI